MNYDVKSAVEEITTILAHYPPLAGTKLEVSEEGDDLTIINLDGESYFIEIHLKETTVGLKRTPYMQPSFIPGYYKSYPATRFEPEDVEDCPLLECATILQAVTQIVGQEFYDRVNGALEAEGEAKAIAEMEQYAEGI